MNKNPFGTDRHARFALKAFRRLFGSVGRRYSTEITVQPNWVYSSSWSAQQQEAYKRWFVREAMRDLRWGKHKATIEAGWFLLFYGWSIENAKSTTDDRSKAARKGRKNLDKSHEEKTKTRRDRHGCSSN